MSRIRTWNIELDSTFDTGAGIQLRSPEPGIVTFLAPWDGSPLPMWFHFRIRGAKGWRVRFVLANANRCLGGPSGYAKLRVRPVVTEDPPTMRPSRRRWRRVPKEDISYTEQTGQFQFEVNIRSDEAYVAHCYPYGLAEWDELVADFKASPCLATSTIGQTERGRPMPHAQITEGKPDDKRVIWLTARHHSGETSGGWALDGTLRWLLSDDDKAKHLRQRYVFRVMPFADLDGVVEGLYGKERAPHDFNRAYLEDTPRPEIAHFLDAFCAMGDRNLAFFDYHSPDAGGQHQVFMRYRGATSQRRVEICQEYGDALVALSPKRSKLEAKDVREPLYQGDEGETTSTGGTYLTGRIISMTNEVSYALTADDHVLTRRDYRAYGAAIGKAYHRLLSAHEAEIDAGGWRESEQDIKPFADYKGTAFIGAFQWVPLRDVKLSADADAKGEVLRARLLKNSASAQIAGPLRKLGRKKALQLAWRFTPQTKKAKLRALATIFYYGPRGLRYWRDEKLTLDTTSGEWQTCRVQLHPPKGARTVRVSLRLEGGRGLFEWRAAEAL